MHDILDIYTEVIKRKYHESNHFSILPKELKQNNFNGLIYDYTLKKKTYKIFFEDLLECERIAYFSVILKSICSDVNIFFFINTICLREEDFYFFLNERKNNGYYASEILKYISEKNIKIPKDILISCIHSCILNKKNISLILNKYFDVINKDDLQSLYLLSYHNMDLIGTILNSNCPIEFKNKIVCNLDNRDIYLFFKHFVKKDLEFEGRRKMFQNILDLNSRYFFIKPLLDNCNEEELNIIYDKYYENLFSNTRKYNDFLDKCILFGKVLRKKERTILIRRLKAPTRLKDISYVIDKINFEEEELKQLKSMQVLYKLKIS